MDAHTRTQQVKHMKFNKETSRNKNSTILNLTKVGLNNPSKHRAHTLGKQLNFATDL